MPSSVQVELAKQVLQQKCTIAYICLVVWLNKIIYKNQLSRLPGSSLKVCAVVVVVDGGGGDSGGGGGRVVTGRKWS